MPRMDHHRRIKPARYLIDEDLSRARQFGYDEFERIVDFGITDRRLDRMIDSGEPFRTSGCEGHDGQAACNRPYTNSRPGPDIRNFPFAPNADDIHQIQCQLGLANGSAHSKMAS